MSSSGPDDKKNKTIIVYDEKSIISYIVQFMFNAKDKMDLFGDKHGPSIIVSHDIYKDNYKLARNRGVKIRYMTEITKENISHCKEVREIVDELKHLEG